ncbi:MAG: putative secreted protein [Bacteroidetes bacterium]|nr:putative secreted protein [Bacteroidota bacterium]
MILLAGFTSAGAQQQSVIREILSRAASGKVTEMQKLIHFDDVQARELEAMEFQYLLNMEKVETGCRCRIQKRRDKLNRQRDIKLQKILTREQYLKYDALDKDKIRKLPLRLTE